MPPELWFPTATGTTCVEGRKICADCPVLPQCLEHALSLEHPERHGMWGGAGERTLRRMRQLRRAGLAWLPPAHDPGLYCDGPGCRWCRATDAHRASLAERSGPQQQNSRGARCGYKSTYARGHRCGPCCLAITAEGQALRAAGYELTEWWRRWFGANDSRDLLHHAKVLADFDAIEQAA
jgi:hypothetical protein